MTRAKSYDVIAFGELVIDLVPVSSRRGRVYAAVPGGAPGNVAAGVARLGFAAAMLAKVGDEAFGAAIVEALASAGVETRAIVRAPGLTTMLAVVALNAEGDRDFFFYRENAADMNYAPEEVPFDLIAASRILHVGSLLLGSPISAAAQRRAVQRALDAGALVSADPNFRPALWRDRAAMRAAGREAISTAHIAKLSLEEIEAISGVADAREAVRAIWRPGMIAVAVTKGPEGADIFTDAHHVSVPGFRVDVADTVGCGDAFMAAFLTGLLEAGLTRIDRRALEAIGLRACAAGAVIATRPGALENMPDGRAIDDLLRRSGRG